MVLADSGNLNNLLPEEKSLKITKKQVNHVFLVKEFIPELISFITNNKNHSSYQKFSHNMLTINIYGGASLRSALIANNKDNPIKTEDILKEDHKIDSTNLTLDNPPDGEYIISLDYDAYDKNYELEIFYYDNNTPKLSPQRYSGFFDSSSKTFSFKLNKAANKPINFDEARVFAIPTNVVINNINDKAVLTWEDKIGDINNDVDHYDVYMKKPNEPHLSFLVKQKTMN